MMSLLLIIKVKTCSLLKVLINHAFFPCLSRQAHWFQWIWQGSLYLIVLATVCDEVRLGQGLIENHTRLIKHSKTRQTLIAHGHSVKTNTNRRQQG